MRILKFVLILSLVICFVPFAVSAQSSDSTQAKTQEKKQETTKQTDQKGAENTPSDDDRKASPEISEKDLKGFIDQNANGIDDRIESRQIGKGKGKGQPRDRFIDADGDGICDGKESAIGLRKLFRKRQGQQNK